MLEITIHIPALDKLVDAFGGALAAQAGKPNAAPETKTASRGSSQGNKTAEASAAGAAAEPKTDATTANSSTTTTTTSPSEGTAEDLLGKVKEKAMELSQKKGREVLVATLAEYGATNISGIPADKHEAFLANASAKLA